LSVLPLVFFLVKGPDDYLLAAFIQAMVYVVATALSWVVVCYKRWVSFVKVGWKAVKAAFCQSFPLFVSTAATSVYVACYVVILGYFVEPSQVGQYAAVEKIMRALCYLLLTPILQVMYPYISRLGANDSVQAQKIMRYTLWVVLLFMVAATVFMLVVPSYFIQYIGDSYVGTEKVFYVMAFAPLFIGVGGVLGQLGLLALGNESDKKKFRNVYLLATAISIIAILVFPLLAGIEGAAMALLLTEVIVCGGMMFYGGRFLRIKA
jgi:O-antigen/teichoic acid export membrane protein